MSVLGAAVRFKFFATSRAAATGLIESELRKTLEIGERLGEQCGESKKVPAMMGVDEEMRDWNYFQILEHNAIVNRQVSRVISYLCDTGPPPDPGFDAKRDVLPAGDAGPEQVALFRESVEQHLERAKALAQLRGTAKRNHPLFGPFDAHKWHCMFGFHLSLHRKQAERLALLLGRDD